MKLHPPLKLLKRKVIKHPTIMIGAMAARGGNRERKPLPPTVKADQVKALQRTRRSPKVEAI
jgi:hypothetical protein